MALKEILADVASIATVSISNTQERAYLIKRINDAAEELYISRDLVGCLREQVFAWDTSQNLIAMPSYVYQLRGLKFWRANIAITITDMRPRYGNIARWTNSLQWRLKSNSSPLQRDIVNAAPFSFEIPFAEASDVVITIVGRTPTSTRLSETLTLAAGSTKVVSSYSWLSVESIRKPTTSYDLSVKDADGNLLATIANNEETSHYVLYQLKEGYNPNILATTYTQFLEALYKTRFLPFVNDADEFMCPNYDKAIFWKFLEHYYLQMGKLEDAKYATAKCLDVLQAVARDSEELNEMNLQFQPNGYYSIFSTFRGRMGYYEIPGDFRMQ